MKKNKFVRFSILLQAAFVFLGYLVIYRRVDVGVILLYILASFIIEGSSIAYKWGIFFMFVGWISELLTIIFHLLDYPYFTNFQELSMQNNPFYWPWTAILFAWSLLNFILLIVILRTEKIKFWTKTSSSWIGVAVCMCILFWATIYFSTPDYARRKNIKNIYAEEIAFLKQIIKNDMGIEEGIHTDSPKVLEVFGKYPEIFEVELITGIGGRRELLTNDFDYSWCSRKMRNLGRVKNNQGNEIRLVIYEDYAKNKNNEWVKIVMYIKDIWRSG